MDNISHPGLVAACQRELALQNVGDKNRRLSNGQASGSLAVQRTQTGLSH
jgi:hypothetical protein